MALPQDKRPPPSKDDGAKDEKTLLQMKTNLGGRDAITVTGTKQVNRDQQYNDKESSGRKKAAFDIEAEIAAFEKATHDEKLKKDKKIQATLEEQMAAMQLKADQEVADAAIKKAKIEESERQAKAARAKKVQNDLQREIVALEAKTKLQARDAETEREHIEKVESDRAAKETKQRMEELEAKYKLAERDAKIAKEELAMKDAEERKRNAELTKQLKYMQEQTRLAQRDKDRDSAKKFAELEQKTKQLEKERDEARRREQSTKLDRDEKERKAEAQRQKLKKEMDKYYEETTAWRKKQQQKQKDADAFKQREDAQRKKREELARQQYKDAQEANKKKREDDARRAAEAKRQQEQAKQPVYKKPQSLAEKQKHYDTLPPAEKVEQDKWVKKELELAGACSVGYGWYRVPGGFRCKGGYHCVTDASLAAKKGCYYACSVWENGSPLPPNTPPWREDELLVHKFLKNKCPPLSGDKETIKLDGWYWYGPRYKANDLRDHLEMNERIEAMLTEEQQHQVNLVKIRIAKKEGDLGVLAEAQQRGYDIGGFGAGAGPRGGPGRGGGFPNYQVGNHQSPYYRPKK